MEIKSGGQLLIDSLIANGVRHAFGVPGESYLAAIDGFYDRKENIQFIQCRHEGGAAFMAEAYGKLNGTPGICFVTRGPGATNSSIGVHTAFQDSTPMILLIGQVESEFQDREGFQEIDYRRMFGQMSKWVGQIDCVNRIPEYINKAFQIATAGRQGPVVLALPEDMLAKETNAEVLSKYKQNYVSPDPSKIIELQGALLASKRPLVLIGGGGWSKESAADIEEFLKRWQLPVSCSFRFQDVFDNSLPNYAGEVGSTLSPALKQRFNEADLIIAIGVRLGEGTTRGYTLIKPPRPKQKLIHIHPGAEELGSVYQADIMIQTSLKLFAAEVVKLKPTSNISWTEWTKSANQDYVKHSTPPSESKGDINLGRIVSLTQIICPIDTIYCSGAGNYAGWFVRYIRYRGLSEGSKTQIAPSSGAMGYGVPSSIAAKISYPKKTVVSISGDGCFLMNGQELATAVHNNLAIIFIVINNNMYGTIRMHQEMYFPDRTIGTDLTNPDFVCLAKSYGVEGQLVTKTSEYENALRKAVTSGKPYLIEIKADPNVISTSSTIEQIRSRH